MQTTLQFAESGGRLKRVVATIVHGGKPLFNLQYAAAATVWRINLGWRRRKEKSILGFNIDAATGYWSKDDQAPVDQNDAADQAERHIQRISPYVEDRRNLLLLRPAEPLEAEEITTLQYALKRGIEERFQIEEAELMVEPLPNRDHRQTILFYEAAEGGAGVLTRLLGSPEAIGEVARKALEICHYRSDDDWHTPPRNDSDECEAGCYRCLLSYYNQPDHALIDRRNPRVLELLVALTRARLERAAGGRSGADQKTRLAQISGSSLERAWLAFVEEHGYRPPDDAQVLIEHFATRPDFVYREPGQTAVYIDGPHHEQPQREKIDRETTAKLEAAGVVVVRFPREQAQWPAIFARYPEIFGAPDR
ncbi:MAG TPA: DUF1998 domain-containing protein [Thiolapillus brandeum]|uniref:DUF1998 domain-containing protein n=1 Tax=Thiolapillus brandeum TaxID=1076588 RepID=A0A7C5IZX2_9GAMM|nr:DUF1998 domain-containing protein [Thiolapillus brandeum]